VKGRALLTAMRVSSVRSSSELPTTAGAVLQKFIPDVSAPAVSSVPRVNSSLQIVPEIRVSVSLDAARSLPHSIPAKEVFANY
jgi:hypothetical protein